MNDIVLNGETLEMSNVIDTIVIEGFDHTFTDGKVESDLVLNVEGGGSATLITKTFDQNGTYSAATYSADGFSEVTVDVPGDDTNIWQGTKSDFESLVTLNPKTVYRVYKMGAVGDTNKSYLYQIWVGNTRVFPPIKDGYDFWIQNYDQSNFNVSKNEIPNNWIDTGIELNSSENVSRDWQMEFKVSSIHNINSDHVICGIDSSYSKAGLKELYTTGAGILYINDHTSGDSSISSGSIKDEDCVLKRENGVYKFYQNGTLTGTRNAGSSVGGTELGIGVYSTSYGIGLYIDYFGFKWLD